MSPKPAVYLKCDGCGASFKRRDAQHRFCTKACAKRGERNPTWKGGESIDGDGYRVVATGQGKRVREHRAISERALGRPLPRGVEVHHHNSVRADNRRGNLVICQDRGYHRDLEARRRVQLAGGRPFVDALCSTCGVKPLTDFYQVKSRGRLVRSSHCRACTNAARTPRERTA